MDLWPVVIKMIRRILAEPEKAGHGTKSQNIDFLPEKNNGFDFDLRYLPGCCDEFISARYAGPIEKGVNRNLS